MRHPLLFLLIVLPLWSHALADSGKAIAQQPSYLREQPACNAAKASDAASDALACYIKKPEPDYQWTLKNTTTEQVVIDKKSHTITRYSLELTSLRWPHDKKVTVDHPVWKHRLTLYVPEKVTKDTALFFIDNGTLYTPPKVAEGARSDGLSFARIAAKTQSVAIDLKDIPNQYLTFSDSKPLKEDALIAYTWARFMLDPDKNGEWPLRFPMVKSVISAMNATESFTQQLKHPFKLEHFVVSGASKRGWTTWIVAALDNRVSAAIPLVADFMNLPAMVDHLFNVYQQGNPAIAAYMPLRPMIGQPAMNKLFKEVDPYQYRKSLTLPTFSVTASGDNFVPSDTTQFFFSDLPGRKWMRALPNQNHYIFWNNGPQTNSIVESFYGAFIDGNPLPDIQWQYAKGKLVVESSIKPKAAQLWQAVNPVSRDFRKVDDNVGVSPFRASSVLFTGKTTWTANVTLSTPKKGWQASFVEMTFNNPPYDDLVFTTRVFVTPDAYPNHPSPKTKQEKK
ncbi:PhoPQ-activated protein PqaA family protein [Candidatus Sororendozoicomonas aggregata]|uniref:PhoPQ-activated protein PqaA family protein n=1 Tax=Candidatus Sororendozoicomonas aggregata TaxID=3073239 RepID=UPI002ED19D96